MPPAAPAAIAATRAVEAVLREDRGRLLSALIARLRDFQLAEDALQEAALSAVTHWGRSGLPDSPQGWLLRVALRKALDRIRAQTRETRRAADQAVLAREEAAEDEMPDIPDDRLRLIFTCCHPALEEKTRVALTLRTLCGLATAEVAAVFLDAEPTMGQRLSRARAKIAAARIPFAVPGPEDWSARLSSVLTVIYLIFTRGYALGPAAQRDLCEEAIFLTRLLSALRPGDAEIEGCLALLLLTHARAAARIGPDGATVPLDRQDRTLWSEPMRTEGLTLLDRAIARRRPGPYQVKAAIAALHGADGPVDWLQIAALHARLHDLEPSPVVRLSHAIALAEGQGPAVGLPLIEALAADLGAYPPFHAARAEYLARLGRREEARSAYDAAIALAPSEADRLFLHMRREGLPENPAG
jgi:RNA polymerase sigma-70 factor (ECF subfamily)